MKIGLGTVQFGLDYGISNQGGRTSEAEVAKILALAGTLGITVIDTASLYGESEKALGCALPKRHPFKVVTKTIRFDKNKVTADDALLLERAFRESLSKLRCNSVYGLLFHNANDLLADGGGLLYDTLLSLKVSGAVEKIGVSVYTAQQLDEVIARYRIDLVQLPLNVLDQRLFLSGHLAALKRAGIEVHVRSSFLQGLLLMDPERLTPHFYSVRQHLFEYNDFLRAKGLTRLQGALGFVCGLGEVDSVVCGVNDHLQLEEICCNCRPLPSSMFSRFGLTDPAILDPSKWVL